MKYTCFGIYFICIYRKICKCVEDGETFCVICHIMSHSELDFDTFSHAISTTLANLSVNAKKVYARTCVCHAMLHEYFGGFKVKCQVLSQT